MRFAPPSSWQTIPIRSIRTQAERRPIGPSWYRPSPSVPGRSCHRPHREQDSQMTDCTIEHRAVSLKRGWIIPVIIGVIAIGLWSGHHQPEPVTCEPGLESSCSLSERQPHVRRTGALLARAALIAFPGLPILPQHLKPSPMSDSQGGPADRQCKSRLHNFRGLPIHRQPQSLGPGSRYSDSGTETGASISQKESPSLSH